MITAEVSNAVKVTQIPRKIYLLLVFFFDINISSSQIVLKLISYFIFFVQDFRTRAPLKMATQQWKDAQLSDGDLIW